jgi:hypothetical protein
MKLNLSYYLNHFHCHEHNEVQTDEYYILQDLRRDLVLSSNNDNLLKIRIYTGKFWNSNVIITGWEFYFIVKEKPSDEDSDAVINIHQTTPTDPMDGKTEIAIPLLAGSGNYGELVGNYLYELKAKTLSGKIIKLSFGTICFEQSLFD